MFAYVTLLLASATTFPGGNADAFGKAVADASSKSVIVISVTNDAVPKFVFDASNLENFSDQVRSKTKFRKVGGEDYFFSEQKFVQATFKELFDGPKPGPTGSEKIPDGMITNGNVTLDTTKGGEISLFALSKAAGWSRPVTLDYLFQNVAISAEVKNMSEMTFWLGVAKALGGSLDRTDAGYHVAYDPSQLRMMLANTMTLPSNQAPSTSNEKDIKRTFFMAAVQDLGDDELVGVFNAPGNMPSFNVTSGGIADAAWTYIRAMAALEGGGNGQGSDDENGTNPQRRGGNQPAVKILNGRIDTRVPAHLRIGANGAISISVPVIARGSRQSAYIEV